ncbi:hypothetical protein JOM56_007425 [Amanita muscaria]
MCVAALLVLFATALFPKVACLLVVSHSLEWGAFGVSKRIVRCFMLLREKKSLLLCNYNLDCNESFTCFRCRILAGMGKWTLISCRTATLKLIEPTKSATGVHGCSYRG